MKHKKRDEIVPDGFEILDYTNTPTESARKFTTNGKNISSVRRTFDNEIFSIGDKIGDIYGHEFGNITAIWISFDQMRIDIGNLGLVLREEIIKL